MCHVIDEKTVKEENAKLYSIFDYNIWSLKRHFTTSALSPLSICPFHFLKLGVAFTSWQKYYRERDKRICKSPHLSDSFLIFEAICQNLPGDFLCFLLMLSIYSFWPISFLANGNYNSSFVIDRLLRIK